MTLPEGWTDIKIRDFFSSSIPGDWGTDCSPDNGVPVLRSTNFCNDGSIDYTDIAYRRVEEGRLRRRRVDKETILIEKSGGSSFQAAGRVVYCDRDFNGTASNFIEVVKVKDGFSSRYVAFLLYYLYQIGLVQKYQQQTTGIINFKLYEYYNESVRCPFSKLEQEKIAEILTTVDRTIEQTEAMIAKQQRIKTGLMQDLLTRGIDEQGNLRSEKTHKFKDSPLGRIPVAWADKKLSDIYVDDPKNGIFKTAKEIGAGMLMIGQTSIISNRRIDYQLARRANVSRSEWLSYGLREKDILITRVYATVDGVGLPVYVDSCPEPVVYESNMLRLRLDINKILPLYAFYWLQSTPVRTFVISSVNASNQTSINQRVVDRILIALPTKPEQEVIANILSEYERGIEDTAKQLSKLHFQKIALMQDLLTGRRRITLPLKKEVLTI